MKRLVLVAGTSNMVLANSIARHLDISLVDSGIRCFANGEIYCQIGQNVRGADVFVIQSVCPPRVNDYLMELLIIIDALKRASAQSIIAVVPHFGYARQDRKVNPRSPISAKLVANLLTIAGATRVITMDVHTGQIQGFFDIPCDNIYASPVMLKYIQSELSTQNLVCVSPDSGGMHRVRHFAEKLKCDIAMIDKRRVAPNVAQAMNLVGDVRGKDVIIIDDIIDTAGTLIESVTTLKQKGAREIYACATHPVFSDPAYERISRCDDLNGVIITDTVPLDERWTKLSKIKVLPTAEILAKAIDHTFNDDSVSSLFI